MKYMKNQTFVKPEKKSPFSKYPYVVEVYVREFFQNPPPSLHNSFYPKLHRKKLQKKKNLTLYLSYLDVLFYLRKISPFSYFVLFLSPSYCR